MKVLFTHSYFLRFDHKQLKTASPYPPLGTLYAAAYLRHKGIQVSLADLQISGQPSDIRKHLQDFKPDVLVICDDSFNYLTKMCLTNMREAAFKMQQIAASLNVSVIVASSDASDHPLKYLQKGANFVVIGEAEQTLYELITSLLSNTFKAPETIAGLAYLSNGSLIKTLPRKVLKELDTLPEPAWDLINLESYKNTWLKAHGFFSINLVTTRGCPYKCNWCAKPVYGNRYNSHSPRYIARQIKALQAKVGFSHVWFADDIFGLKPGWVAEFSEEVIKAGLQFSFKIQSRADLLQTEETLRHLKQAGCEQIWIGAESGSQKILDAMDKGTTVEQIELSTRLMKKAGIKPCFFLQLGYPGETIDDINKTIALVERLQPFDIGISVSYPLPGTGFYEKVKADLKDKQNWTDSDDLHLMFKSTYAPGFYRYLQRLLHYKFRKDKINQQFKMGGGYKRLVLIPFYVIKQQILRSKLKSIEPSASQLFFFKNLIQ